MKIKNSRDVLFITFLLLIFLRDLHSQSPCPKYFEYKTDENGTYGLLHIFLKEPSLPIASITTLVNFTISGLLPSKYLGKLEPLNKKQDFNLQLMDGKPIEYKVHFPVTTPLPQITSIKVNDDVVCSGPEGTLIKQKLFTKVGLQHIFQHMFHSYSSRPENFGMYDMNRVVIVNLGSNAPNNERDDDTIIINNPSQGSIDWNALFNRPEATKTLVTSEPPHSTTSPHPVPKLRTTANRNECGVQNSDIESLPLIYQGTTYERGMWPWMVAIFKRKDFSINFICSGTLVSDRHVITAAHCIHSKNSSRKSVSDIVVKAGVYILDEWDDDNAVVRQLSSGKEHESFNPQTLANDIALLTFTKRVEFNAYIRAACLWTGNPDRKLIVNSIGVVTGWGVSEVDPAGRGKPRKVLMPIVSTEQCRASKLAFHQITSNTTLCAGDRNGSGPCSGDSGGGLFLPYNGRWTLRGIVSTSLRPWNTDTSNCNLKEYVVFTDAAQYQTWISDNMKTD